MKVFANICEPHSFMRAIMKDGESYNVSSCTFFENLALNTALLKRVFPNNPVTVLTSGHSVFSKIYIDYIKMHASYQMTGDYRKLIEIFNVAGKLLFSIGFKADPYGNSDVQPLTVYSWNQDGTLKGSKSENSGLYPISVTSNYSDRAFNRAVSFYYFNDPNDISKTKIEIYYGAELLLTVAGSEMGDQLDKDPAVIYYFRNTLNAPSGDTYRHRVSYIVVTDTLNLSLEPIILKPLAFTYSADFTGNIAALRENLQDEVFVSCAAETGKYIEFTIALVAANFNQLLTAGTVSDAVMYFYARYLQIGGISAGFNIDLYNGTDLYYSESVSVAANEDSAFYRTKALTNIGTAITGLLSKQVLSFKIRISLKEV